MGARLIDVGRKGAQLDLRRAMRALARAGLTQLLVEGGGGLAAALLREDLVDEVHWFLAPKLLGGDARAALGPLATASLASALHLEDVRVRRIGVDLHVHGRIRRRAAARRRGARA